MTSFPRRFDPGEPELMDRPQPVTPELEKDLANLRSLNRYFGSYRIVRRVLRRRLASGPGKVRVLDLATGSGDIPRLVADECRRLGREAEIEALDFQEATLEIARRLSREYPEIRFTASDIRNFVPESPSDVVICTLALHHFSEEDAVTVLARAARWARRTVLVADLRRARLTSAGIHLVTSTVYREEMTRVDARLSAARAFSFEEMAEMAQRAGWESFRHRRLGIAWQALWMDVGA